MRKFRWDEEKNRLLKKKRGVSFEDILGSKFLGAEKHRTRNNQMVLLFEHEKYVWVVPCVVEEKYVFLKTVFPSRKYTKMLESKEGTK
jgi:uncharacterized DUF497 family protein